MPASEAESTSTCFPLVSKGAEKGKVNGTIIEDVETIKKVSYPLDGFHSCKKCRAPFWAVWIFICNVVFIITIAAISAVLISGRRETQLHPPTAPVYSCPGDWIGYRGKCYYFADAERDWESSRKNCSAFNAFLVVIDSQEEMDFLRRYKTAADHWVGLQRNEKTAPWRWINNTIFNNAFPIRGSGTCAYVYNEGIASSSCGREEPWICSKPPASHQRGVAPVAKPCSASSRRESTKES